MRLERRTVILSLFGLQLAGCLLVVLGEVFDRSSPQLLAYSISGLVMSLGVALLYWAGWEPARLINIGIVTVLIGAALPQELITDSLSFMVLVPAALAMILGGPGWIAGTGAAMFLIITVRAGGFDHAYVDIRTFAAYLLIIGSMALGRIIADSAETTAEVNARHADVALSQARKQAQENAAKAAALEDQNQQQQDLLALVSTLETPAFPLADGVLLAPVLGHLDTRRAETLTERLLHEAHRQRTRLMVIDLAGVAAFDTGTAQALLRTVQALRLLGCDVTLTGITAEVAATISGLNIPVRDLKIARSPQDALRQLAAARGTSAG
ncbi:MAG TPA: STAS domain-containing protein [Herpetosiphonaceae bacterium]